MPPEHRYNVKHVFILHMEGLFIYKKAVKVLTIICNVLKLTAGTQNEILTFLAVKHTTEQNINYGAKTNMNYLPRILQVAEVRIKLILSVADKIDGFNQLNKRKKVQKRSSCQSLNHK